MFVKLSMASGVAESKPSCRSTRAIDRWRPRLACPCRVGVCDAVADGKDCSSSPCSGELPSSPSTSMASGRDAGVSSRLWLTRWRLAGGGVTSGVDELAGVAIAGVAGLVGSTSILAKMCTRRSAQGSLSSLFEGAVNVMQLGLCVHDVTINEAQKSNLSGSQHVLECAWAISLSRS